MASTGFVDVTSGSNDFASTGSYSATTGYDMASGLGSPSGAAFFTGLCPIPFSAQKSSFVVSAPNSVTGITVNATLNSATSTPIANAGVTVTATSASGQVQIDNDPSSTTASGATEQVYSNALGVASFNVTSTTTAPVSLTVTYNGQTIYTTSLSFAASAVMSAPSIALLSSSATSLTFRVSASAAKTLQYSLNGGVSWKTIPTSSTSVVASGLRANTTYQLVARTTFASGTTKLSNALSVKTK
jgi:hypothetical protein